MARTDLPGRKKSKKKSKHFAFQIKKAVVAETNCSEAVDDLRYETVCTDKEPSSTLSLYKQFSNISQGGTLGKRVPRKKQKY